ncbi:hypothetical protein [Demequina muriae]|uniref:Heme peroxidase n=1 Tax=Demequina muriae TaxID=3051664 RepID=A0ABT8GE48_9MICO|nr:hypothetical protein [Demequina sp. EGI L300058]MDN4479703.1 hypothetical protein [Demequina sp. EGI L300058]
MTVDDKDDMTEKLTLRVQRDFPDGIPMLTGYGYPDSLALCAIDSVYSLSVRYGATRNVVARYVAHRAASGANANTDSLDGLLRTINAVGGAAACASVLFENQHRAPGTKRLKSEALHGAASKLVALDIRTTEDLRGCASEDLANVGRAWTSESGLGYASWRYLLMLAGVPGVKIDRMISRYVVPVLGKNVTKSEIEATFAGVAERLEVGIHELDHAVWRKQSGRVGSA